MVVIYDPSSKSDISVRCLAVEQPTGNRSHWNPLAWQAIKDEEVGPDEVPVDQLQKAYKPTTELPAEVRKKYSLTYGTSDDPGSTEKGK